MNRSTNISIILFSFLLTATTTFCQEWSPFGNILSSDNNIYDIEISDDGLTLAIGSPFDNNNVGNHGTVSIYNWDGNNWIQKGDSFNGENLNDNLGFAVSLNDNGNIIVIGTPKSDGANTDQGKSDVYSWDGNAWQQMGNSIPGDGDNNLSGSSVQINSTGNIIAIGAFNNGDNGIQSGHVKVLQWDGFDWVLMGSTINGESQGDRSGYSISLDSGGNSIAIGAITNSDGGSKAGHVRVFNFNGLEWIQRGEDIDGFTNERFGRKVSLSGNGNRLAIGASINSDDDTGLARIYNWDGTDWIQMGNDFVGENQGDELGSGIALNEDGGVLVIGSPGHEGVLPNNGQVKVYTWQNNSWNETNSTVIGTFNGTNLGYDVDVNLSGDYATFTSGQNAQVLKKSIGTSINSVFSQDALVIKIIPNPARNRVKIDCPEEIEEIAIVGLNGLNIVQTLNTNSIDISHLPSGIYFIKVKTKLTSVVKKLIKNP